MLRFEKLSLKKTVISNLYRNEIIGGRGNNTTNNRACVTACHGRGSCEC